MPLISYVCKCGNSEKKFIRKAGDALKNIPCPKCGLEMGKALSTSSFDSKISIDNGVQSRRVEINLDTIITNMTDRANKNYRED